MAADGHMRRAYDGVLIAAPEDAKLEKDKKLNELVSQKEE